MKICRFRIGLVLLIGGLSLGLAPLFSRAAERTPASRKPEAAAENTLTKQELDDGWIQLFDGKTLFGWSKDRAADWKVADGVISVGSGKPGLLRTTSEFGDYVLKVDFRAPKSTNSGIFLRVPAGATHPASDCYEANIAAPSVSPFPTGSLMDRKKGTFEKTDADWRTYEIRVAGGHVTLKVDGVATCDYTDPKPAGRGFIGLQFNSGKVAFRNIKLKPLGLKSLFNGRDLTGWKLFPGKTTVATVTKTGDLNVKHGWGALISDKQFGDFTLQTEAICNAKKVNSGIFFRCVPGQLMNGYECQIYNGFKNGDRTKPIEFGTGGVYHRQNARRVISDDRRWFHVTIIAIMDRRPTTIGGPPQILCAMPGAQATAVATEWEIAGKRSVYLQGRPTFAYERLNVPLATFGDSNVSIHAPNMWPPRIAQAG